MMGREPKLPVDLKWGVGPPNRAVIGTTYSDYVDQKTDMQAADFQLARQNIGRAATARKTYYDSRVRRGEPIRQGDVVYYYSPRKNKGRCPKWQKLFTGPFTVLRVIDDYNFIITRSAKSKPLVVHRDKLKLLPGTVPAANWVGPIPTPVPAGRDDFAAMQLDPNVDCSPNLVHDLPVDQYDQQINDGQQTQLYTYSDQSELNPAGTPVDSRTVSRPVRRTRHQQPARYADFHCFSVVC
jgi:hypothetical protein